MIALLYLICGHYLADFGLQNDFIAKTKVPQSAPFWLHVMVAHCTIQALPVLLVTNLWYLGVGEFASHFAIDYAKCKGRLTFTEDQLLHLLCKLLWFGVFKLVVLG